MSAPVVVVGDCLLDVGIRPHGPIEFGADAPARVDLGPGGGAANVAVRLARAGIAVRLVAPLASDPAGALLAGFLAADGVELVPLAAERTGAVAILIAADGERTMLSQRASSPADVAERAAAAISDAGWVHVSGYALLDARGAQLAQAVAGRPAGVPLAIAAPPLTASIAAAFRELARAARPELLFANAHEAGALLDRTSGPLGAAGLAADLAAMLGTAAVVTERRALAAALPGGPPACVDVPPADRGVVDSTGAGDAVAAAVTADLIRARWPPSQDVLSAALSAAVALAVEVVAAAGAQAPVASERGLVAESDVLR